MLRCFFFLPIFGLATVLLGSISSIVGLIDRTGRISHYFARYWSKFIFAGVGIDVVIKGIENIPTDRPVIFAGNHQSTLDIPALFGYLPAQFRILAKRTLFLVPFLGWHLYIGGNIPIDRKNVKKAYGSVFQAAARIKKGISLFIFAEGTRSRDGKLQRFKRGGFTLARKLKVPIVPVAIKGTIDLMPAGSWLARGGKVEIVIMPAVEPGSEVPNQIEDEVRQKLLAAGLEERV